MTGINVNIYDTKDNSMFYVMEHNNDDSPVQDNLFNRYLSKVNESIFMGTYLPRWAENERDILVREWRLYSVCVNGEDVSEFVGMLQGMGYAGIDIEDESDGTSTVEWEGGIRYLAVMDLDRVPPGYSLVMEEDGTPKTMYLDSKNGWDYTKEEPVQIPFYCIHEL